MTDTATPKRIQKPRDVDYTLEIVDDLPDIEVSRRSVLQDQIDKVIANTEAHGRFVQIGSYANGSAASAAANVLRKRHGDKAAVDGFTVKPVRITGKNGEPRTGLFVKYDPEAIIPGERERFNERLKAREAKVAAKRAEREAAEKAEAEKEQAPAETPSPAPKPAPVKAAAKKAS